jgi:hypothetical protein
MTIYTAENDTWQMTVDNRLQGWQVEVSKWTGEHFHVRYDVYVIAESLFEATFDALIEAGFPENNTEYQLAEWGIFMPEEDED